ncbi:hypothetical protein D3C74_317020 [compost metagenome]
MRRLAPDLVRGHQPGAPARLLGEGRDDPPRGVVGRGVPLHVDLGGLEHAVVDPDAVREPDRLARHLAERGHLDLRAERLEHRVDVPGHGLDPWLREVRRGHPQVVTLRGERRPPEPVPHPEALPDALRRLRRVPVDEAARLRGEPGRGPQPDATAVARPCVEHDRRGGPGRLAVGPPPDDVLGGGPVGGPVRDRVEQGHGVPVEVRDVPVPRAVRAVDPEDRVRPRPAAPQPFGELVGSRLPERCTDELGELVLGRTHGAGLAGGLSAEHADHGRDRGGRMVDRRGRERRVVACTSLVGGEELSRGEARLPDVGGAVEPDDRLGPTSSRDPDVEPSRDDVLRGRDRGDVDTEEPSGSLGDLRERLCPVLLGLARGIVHGQILGVPPAG